MKKYILSLLVAVGLINSASAQVQTGDLYSAYGYNGGIKKTSSDGTTSTLAYNGTFSAIAVDAQETVYAAGVVNGSFGIYKYSVDGTPSLFTTTSSELTDLSFKSIPEPSTYALFGIGVIGMLMALRRKKAV